MNANIITAETYFANRPIPVKTPGGQVLTVNLASLGIPHSEWPLFIREGYDYAAPIADSNAKKDALPAQINHGRWVVQCPCDEQQFASDEDRRFYCTSCRNMAAGGKRVKVIWPDQQTRFSIERLMYGRYEKHQNWLPNETVNDLAAENKQHGVKN